MRSMWKGQFRVGLVTLPVKLINATSEADQVKFHLLHKDTQSRINIKPVDPKLGPFERCDLVRGYEFDKDQYIIFTEDDFEKIKIESDKTIVVSSFVDAKDVDSIYLDSPYYLVPDGTVAEEGFRTIQVAMRKLKKVGLSRIVLSRRERLILLSPRGRGLLMTTLRTSKQIRSELEPFAEIGTKPPAPAMLQLAETLIKQQSGPFDPSTFIDRYQEALIAMVKAKMKGAPTVAAKVEVHRRATVNLGEALKQSIEAAGKKPPAKSKSRPREGEAVAKRPRVKKAS